MNLLLPRIAVLIGFLSSSSILRATAKVIGLGSPWIQGSYLGCSLYSVYFESLPLSCWSVLLPPSLPSPLRTFWPDFTNHTDLPSPLSTPKALLPLLPLPSPPPPSRDFQIQKQEPNIYSLAGTTGCVRWFLQFLYWPWQDECQKMLSLFKLLPKGAERTVRQTVIYFYNFNTQSKRFFYKIKNSRFK